MGRSYSSPYDANENRILVLTTMREVEKLKLRISQLSSAYDSVFEEMVQQKTNSSIATSNESAQK